MPFNVSKDLSEAVAADALVIPCYESDTPLKGYKYAAAVEKLFHKGDFTGKGGQTLVLPAAGAVAASRVILLGLGKKEKACVKTIGDAFADVYRNAAIDGQKIKHLAIATEVIGAPANIKAAELGRGIAEAAVFGSYRFLAHHTKDKHVKKNWVESTTVAGVPGKVVKDVQKLSLIHI